MMAVRQHVRCQHILGDGLLRQAAFIQYFIQYAERSCRANWRAWFYLA